MGKKYGLDLPDGAKLQAFESYGDAWVFARSLERLGYIRPRSAGRHTGALKVGKYVIFKHDRAVWVAWMEPKP